MSDNEEDEYIAYTKDPRIPCRFGAKCYRKNSVHVEQYKHPPKKNTVKQKTVRKNTGLKRKKVNEKDDSKDKQDPPAKKVQRTSPEPDVDTVTPAADDKEEFQSQNDNENSETSEETEGSKSADVKIIELVSLSKESDINSESFELSRDDAETVISSLFLTKMPEEFYEFYELCKSISKENPAKAFKDINLYLVGPFDVFSNKFLNSKVEDKEKLLVHWRYYYDPPEFQTIIKIDGKDGLHYGYWRDDMSEKPVFVAGNKVNVDCTIEPVAENIFGAVDLYIEDKLKAANPFEKARITRLRQYLRNYAKDKKINLEKKTPDTQAREKKVVAKTFHNAGIIVPYNKRTELGYRELALSNKELKAVLKNIENATTDEERKAPMSKIDEVIRLAVIAADECDFGTCLELGHDLFSSGIVHVQNKALQVLSIAYLQLQRPEFLEIIKAHLKSRKKGSNLSIVSNETDSPL